MGADARAGFRVEEVRALRGRARAGEARALLERAAQQVQPLMRRRGWACPSLVEFEPRSANLLGLNVGGGGGRTRQIKVRVRRPPGPSDEFFPYEDVLGTLLHELVHNVRGPHDAKFYALLDEITTECEKDMAAGVSGTGRGFDAPPAGRIGGRGPVPAHSPDRARLREAMARAAEQRCRNCGLMLAGGQRLGGNRAAAAGLTPAQAASRAAERRQKDDVWCPGAGIAGPDGQVVDLDEEEAPGEAAPQQMEQRPAGAASGAAGPAGPGPSGGGGGTAKVEVIELSSSGDEEEGARPRPPPGKRQRREPPENGGAQWACRECTLLNPRAATHCAACGAWAFTRGPPVGAGTLHFST